MRLIEGPAQTRRPSEILNVRMSHAISGQNSNLTEQPGFFIRQLWQSHSCGIVNILQQIKKSWGQKLSK